MNPALPVLLSASLLGLAFRRPAGGAWTAIGLAGSYSSSRPLRIADGVPSPAASLAEHAPWLSTADPAAGNPTLLDVTFQIQPWLIHLRRELRAGRLPFWNPHQFAGSPSGRTGRAPLLSCTSCSRPCRSSSASWSCRG